MSSPTVSIIIACYNARATLGATLDSLMAQIYTDFEIVVVDAASQDGSVELLKSYGERIDKWISEPDAGIYDAWNKGLKLARGRWIGFLGADDVYLPNALQEYVQCINNQFDLDYISARVELFDDRGQTRVIGQSWQWQRFKHFMCVAHTGSLHARSLFDKYGQFDLAFRICGDYELLLRAGPLLRTGYVDQVLTRMQAGGVSASNKRALAEARHAKIQAHSVSPTRARWDYYLAMVKWHVRQILGRL